MKDQVCWAVASCDAWLIAWANLIPVVTGLHTARATGIIHSTVFALSSCTALLRLPVDFDALSLAGTGVCQKRLTIAVFMNWTFTHVCHTGPVESRIVHC